VITGVQRGSVWFARPELVTDHDLNQSTGSDHEGNGYSVAGVRTALPCPCDASQGLLCSADLTHAAPGPDDVCLAFPVVHEGCALTLRGYNFWDAEWPAILLTRVLDSHASTASFLGHTTGADTSDGAGDCAPADRRNELHDTLTYRTPAITGFYFVQVFNLNGNLTFRGEPTTAPGRTVHVCWRLPDGQAFPPEATTNVSCASDAPNAACPLDGTACPASAWTDAPRMLAPDCQHSPVDPAVCGETPQWIGSIRDPRLPTIIYVQGYTNPAR
jgi:hypothetical protein